MICLRNIPNEHTLLANNRLHIDLGKICIYFFKVVKERALRIVHRLECILNRNAPIGRKQQFNQLQHTAVYFHKSLLSFPDCYGHLYFY